MNESGPAIASLARKHGVEPDHVVAVHDEIDLPFGALRVKSGGSTAGHNGLRSLQQALRTPDFFRVRLGVGRPTGRRQAADWVLDTFAKREEPEVAILVDDAADAVRLPDRRRPAPDAGPIQSLRPARTLAGPRRRSRGKASFPERGLFVLSGDVAQDEPREARAKGRTGGPRVGMRG